MAFHALQHLVDFRHFIGALRATPVLQKTVGLVQQQHCFFLFGFLEHGRHVLLGLAYILTHQITGLFDDEGLVQCLCNVLGKRRLTCAGRAVKAQRTMAAGFERFNDAGNLKP